MLRKRIIFTLLAFIAIGFAARESITSTLFEWYLKGYCRSCLHSRLTYESLHKEGDNWVFVNPVLTTKNRLEEGGYRFQANNATVHLSIYPFSRTLALDVSLDHPQIDVGKGANDLLAVLEQPTQTFHLFEVHTQFSVPQGTLFVHDFTEEHLVPVPLSFSIDMICKNNKHGCISVWPGKEVSENTGFVASFYETDQGKQRVDLKFNKLCCSALQKALRGLWPEYTSLDIVKGSLDGMITVSLPEEGASYADGSVYLRDLTAHHSELDAVLNIGEAKMSFFPRFSGSGDLALTDTLGEMELTQPATLAFTKDGKALWTLNASSATLGFKSGEHTRFLLDGVVDTQGKQRAFKIDGNGRFAQEGSTGFTFDVSLKGDDPLDETAFHFSTRELGDEWSFCEVDLSGLGTTDLTLLQHLAFKDHPDFKEFEIVRGTFDAAVLVYLKGLSLSEVKVERIAAHGLEFAFTPWDLEGGARDVAGSFSFDLTRHDPFESLNADLMIRKGKLNLAGMEDSKWQFSDIHTKLIVRQGVFQKSVMKGIIAGLKSEVAINGVSDGPHLSLLLSGEAEEFSQAFPDLIRSGIQKAFLGDSLKIEAKAYMKGHSLEFDGKLTAGKPGDEMHDILFGFTVEQTPTTLWKQWPPHPFACEYCPDAGLEAFHALTPSLAEPLYATYKQLISQQIGIAGFTFDSGWFKAQQLPLAKFLSPFMFRNGQMALSGLGDFSGTFDLLKLVVDYNAVDMVLENSDFSIEIKSLSGENGTLPAQCLIDFDNKHIFNSFQVNNGTYFEKNTGLLFTEVNAGFALEDSVARFNTLTAFSNGIFLAGDIDIDWSMPGDGIFEVVMETKEMHGKISQIQHFLSHLDKSLFFLKIPIEGNAFLSKEGGRLQFSFSPEGYEFQTTLKGAISDGAVDISNGDMSLQELSMNFTYDHQGNALDFADIQGTLLVGKPGHVEEYAVSGAGVQFTDYEKNEAVFDVRIGKNLDEVIRVAGRTVNEEVEGQGHIAFAFDMAHTHFGSMKLSKLDLSLKDWSNIDLFTLNLDFTLKELLAEVQRFSHTGLLFLTRGFIGSLNALDQASGQFNAEIAYLGSQSTLSYNAQGKEIAFGGHHFDTFTLAGRKRGELWSVDQLSLDDMSLAFDLLKEGPLWNINFLGARFGNSLLVGLEGQYRDDEACLETRINLLEANLSHINEWPILAQAIKSSPIDGQVKASGILHAEFDKSLPGGVKLDVLMNGSLSNGKFKEIALQDIENVTFHYNTDTGIDVQDIATGIRAHSGDVIAGLYLRSASWDFAGDAFVIDGLYFDVPVYNLRWIAACLQEAFPKTVSSEVAETICSVQTRGSVQGALSFHIAEPYSSMRLALNDGIYTFLGQEHDLSRFALDIDPFAIKVFTEYRYKNQRMRLEAFSPLPSLDSGEIILTDISGQGNMLPAMPLSIQWRNHPQTGMYIQKISGSLAGLTMEMVRDPNKPLEFDRLYMIGQIDINMQQALNLMDDEMAAKVRHWEIGKGFSLSGQWSLEKAADKKLLDCLTFQGELAGRDFEACGYNFYSLSSQASFMPGACYLRGLSIADSCGTLQIEQADLVQTTEGLWHASVPVISLTEFRPSLLKAISSPPPRMAKSLVVRNLTIKDLQGYAGYRETFTGSGQLVFANPPKKNLQHSILAIPAELLTRIGLDLAVLTPVRGTIMFEMANGRANLKKFKDVYSRGKMSKFYLSNHGQGSYVDFDGNLHLFVRMKQYNLIFKLAELFTVTVNGTLQKPTYTLQKQQKRSEPVVIEPTDIY